MGLLQRACETYDANAALVGVYREGHEVLPPIGHILTSANIEITLAADGAFVQAVGLGKDEPKILIPVTEESMGRTSAPCAHPLCDTLAYVGPQNEDKHALYLAQLGAWCKSPHTHPIVQAVLNYVQGGTILEDLERAALITCEHGRPKDEKPFIRWRVTGIAGEEEACWKNRRLHESFACFLNVRSPEQVLDVCMVSGKQSTPAYQHAKGIAPLHGNAKLISANDSSGFTYRGRFSDDREAMNVSFETSQKAHSVLRWLIGEQRVYFGKKAFLCWNPNGKSVPKATDPFDFAEEEDEQADIDAYQKRLQKTLNGYQTSIPPDEAVVIAAFDAATTGRLSLNYYSELPASDFLERLYDWDANCCWYSGKKIVSPKLLTIVSCAFGTERTKFMEVDDRVKAQQVLRLIGCRVNKAPMPEDIKTVLVHRASSPLAYEPANRRLILSTACAVIKKYDYDRKGVTWEMALNPEKHDLSYQYGRLLAVLEKAETDTYEPNSGRESNAIRMQSVFVQRPQYAARCVLEQLKKAYFPRLRQSARNYYERLIGEIYAMIDEFPEQEHNRPLQDAYLMGYYLQRNDLWKSRKNTTENDEEETDNDSAE